MIGKVRVKVCGLTSAEDAAAAASVGADFLGFILYPRSPRYLSVGQFSRLAAELPPLPKVAVMVVPSADELTAALEAGFDLFQIHFPIGEPGIAEKAAARLGAERLWLAPKLPPEMDVEPALLPLARTWLLDTFRPDSFGGTGHIGDWGKFRRHREMHLNLTWVLAGGLAPENVSAAVDATGTEQIDVNSGVESAPGRKDAQKLAALAAALRAS